MKAITDVFIAALLIIAIVFIGLQIPKELSGLNVTSSSLATSPQNIPTKISNKTQSSSTSTTTAATSSEQTANWAGYAATGVNYTAVSGSWQVPNVNSSYIDSSDATWIGIGGISTNDLIQVGTQDIVGSNGQIQSSAFYETLPTVSNPITALNVSPGDSISASLSEGANYDWTITITDNTTGQSYSTTVNYASSNSSAEWIEEAPYDGYSFVPLDDFGTVSFSSASTTDNGSSLNLTKSKATPAVMVNSYGQVLASVSSISSSGSGFTVTRTTASDDVGSSGLSPFPHRFVHHDFGFGL